MKHLPDETDVLIVGAGFAGLYMLHDLRKRGYLTKVIEAGDGIGGTWYWNRYPGARCDLESKQYSYSFSDELQQEWQWSERYATQPEILRYLNHVADRFDLRKDIQLGTRVTSVIFNEDLSRWMIETNRGDRISAKFCVMATGCLSVPKDPNIKGLDQFNGNVYRTSTWPDYEVNFTGRRVAVIGTGSSGIQSIPIIAKQAAQLYVIQRTPNFILPLNNKPVDIEYEKGWKLNYNQRRSKALETGTGVLLEYENDSSLGNMTDEERYEAGWKIGGLSLFAQFKGQLNNKETNKIVSDFIRSKVREIVKDPTVAEALMPYNHYFGVKRPCADTRYYETFNRDNVKLVDIRNKSIDEITPTGIKIEEKIYEVDDIVLAIGFDAITGALLNIDIRGRSGKTLREKWSNGARSFLGMMTADFPNLFIITGPGSPTELSNMVSHIEQNANWITKCIEYVKVNNIDSIEPTVDVQNAWMDHVKAVASQTLYVTSDSWYNGGNIPGKPKVFMPYVGGFQNYLKFCEQVASDGYEKYFSLKRSSSTPNATK
jgi:cyclohexanone monooxygenase